MNIEIFKNKKKFRKGGFHTNPGLGWELVLGVALLLIIASFAFGVYLFMHINKEFESYDAGGTSQVKIVKKERIQKVLEYFSAREQKSGDILNSPSPIIDPSL